MRSSRQVQQDSAVARRLLSVVLTDFLCWVPVGLVGVLAALGTPVPPTVTVSIAVFVMPLNSAINPYLYTFNKLREEWRHKRQLQTKREFWKKVTESDIQSMEESKVNELVRKCLRCKAGGITREMLSSVMQETQLEELTRSICERSSFDEGKSSITEQC